MMNLKLSILDFLLYALYIINHHETCSVEYSEPLVKLTEFSIFAEYTKLLQHDLKL